MLRRLIVICSMLVALVAASHSIVSASEMVNFRLTNDGTTAVSETFFEPLPFGTIVPPISIGPDGMEFEDSPLNALDSSQGVDVDSAFVLLSDEVDDGGNSLERLFLLFGFEPNPEAGPEDFPFQELFDTDGNRFGQLEPGGAFDFELSLQSAQDADLLLPGTEGLTLTLLDISEPVDNPDLGSGNGGVNPVDDLTIPEPAAILLWGVLIGAGLAYSRHRRRRLLAPTV